MSTQNNMPPTAESASVEFKDSFEAKSGWCELIKDIVAMANSGGGRIFVGLFDDGRPSGADVIKLLDTDLADVVNKIRSYTDVNFSSLEIYPVTIDDAAVVVIDIKSASSPLVFGKAGTYINSNGKPDCAFHAGTLYVRHGPKSEPATTDDLRSLIEARINESRKSLLENLRQVVEAPANAVVSIGVPQATGQPGASGTPFSVRIVDEPSAQAAVVLNPNDTHIHRQKEVVEAVNRELQGGSRFTTVDNLAIRRLHPIESNPRFFFKSKTGSPQYSDAYVGWILQQIKDNDGFLSGLRKEFHERTLAANEQRKARRQGEKS